MHNFSTTGSQAEPVLSNNMGIIETAYNNEAYHHWVNASEMEDAGDAASPTYRTGTMSPVVPAHWRLANGVISSLCFYVKRHGEWKDGVLSVVVHYSSTVAGNDIRWRVSVVPITDLTTPTITTIGQAKAAPTVVDVITTVDLSSSLLTPTSQINTGHIGAYITVGRTGNGATDTNTGVVYVYGVDLVYKESRRVVGGR